MAVYGENRKPSIPLFFRRYIMNNDYKGGSWSERFSWIVTIAAMVLVAILSIGN